MNFYLLIVLLFAIIWLAIILSLRSKKSQVFLIFFTLFYVYIFKVLDYTLFQFQSLILLKLFNPHLILNGQAAGEELNLIPFITLTPRDLQTSLLNILLMMPFGFGLPFITDYRLKNVVILGAFFSIIIELTQLVTGYFAKITFRIADINDVIFNAVGVIVGYFLFIGFLYIFRRGSPSWRMSTNPILRYLADRPQNIR